MFSLFGRGDIHGNNRGLLTALGDQFRTDKQIGQQMLESDLFSMTMPESERYGLEQDEALAQAAMQGQMPRQTNMRNFSLMPIQITGSNAPVGAMAGPRANPLFGRR